MTVADIYKMIMDSEDSIVIDEKLMKKLGNNAAIVYSELKQRYSNNSSRGFVCTVDDLQYECNVSRGQQQRILKKLQNEGYVKVSYKGLPKKRYIDFVK